MIREIGITGGIGSGKSTVAAIFRICGFEVYQADERAKALYSENQELKAAITALLGPSVYDESGRLQRQFLADKIFGNEALLKKVNQLVHPAVAQDYAAWLKAIPEDYQREFVLKEAAILFEAGSDTRLDGVIAVYAPVRLRLQRVTSRDGSGVDQVRARMEQQWPDAEKMRRAEFIIFNDGNHMLVPQVLAAIKHFQQ